MYLLRKMIVSHGWETQEKPLAELLQKLCPEVEDSRLDEGLPADEELTVSTVDE